MRLPAHYRVFAGFFLFALALGAMLSRLPDLQEQFELSKSQLGLMLIGMALGSLVSLTLSSPWIDRLGARTTTLMTVIGTALCYAIVPWLPNAVTAFAVLFVAGFLAGMLEINLNLEADRIEAQIGRRVMGRAHGCWSLGFFVTALAGATIRDQGVSIHLHTGVVSSFVALGSLVMFWNMTSAPHRADARPAAEGPRIALPNLGLLPLCIIAIAAFLIEGTGIDWSVIYMGDVFTVSPFVEGLGLTLFTGVMAIGRLGSDPFVDRFGPRAVATTLLLIAACGTLLIGFAQHPYMALAGFALIGLGSSGVYPLAVSAAAQRTDRPASVNVAALAQVSFVIFFLGPPLLGFVAESWGIRVSYLIVLPVIVAGLLLSGALEPRKSSSAVKQAEADG